MTSNKQLDLFTGIPKIKYLPANGERFWKTVEGERQIMDIYYTEHDLIFIKESFRRPVRELWRTRNEKENVYNPIEYPRNCTKFCYGCLGERFTWEVENGMISI